MRLKKLYFRFVKRLGLLNLKPVVFLHLQKTAGTSIINVARQFYGNKNVISHGDYCLDENGILVPGDQLIQPEYKQSRFGNIPFISGHFGYGFAKQFMEDRYSFTFLRDPVERVLSFYFFCKKRNPNQFRTYEIAQRVSLDEFLELGFTDSDIKGHICNHQTSQLAVGWGASYNLALDDDGLLALALQNLNDFSYVGFTETFDKDQVNILRDIGIKIPVGSFKSNSNPGRPLFDGLPQSSKDLLLELTTLDRQLYEKAWSRRNLAN